MAENNKRYLDSHGAGWTFTSFGIGSLVFFILNFLFLFVYGTFLFVSCVLLFEFGTLLETLRGVLNTSVFVSWKALEAYYIAGWLLLGAVNVEFCG